MNTIEFNTQPRWRSFVTLAAVTLLAFAVRWYYVSTAVVLDPVRGDATQYFSYAWNLVNHGIFSKDLPGALAVHPDNYRDPGYPAFLAVWMKLLGTGDAWYAAVLISQAALGALTITLAALVGRHWLPLRWAAAAGVLMALWPHSITINGYLLSETLFGFLTALGVFVCATAFRRQSKWRAFGGGLILGAAALTNAVLLPFGVLLAIFLTWRKLATRTICMALAIGAMTLPAVWTARNAVAVVSVAGDSSADRALLNFVIGSWPHWQSAWRESVLGDQSAKERAGAEMHLADTEYAAWRSSPSQGIQSMARRVASQPLKFAHWYLIEKPTLLWGWSIEIGQGDIFVYPTRNAPFQIQPLWMAIAAICRGFNIWLMLLALGGILFAWRRSGKRSRDESHESSAALIAVALLLVFVTLVYSTLQAEPRYSIPFRPFEILSAVTAVYVCTTWLIRRHGKRRVHQSGSA
jgi:cbb3-type cytochrome oxidase subunit 3